MKYLLSLLFLAVALTGCKTKQTALESTASESKTALKIIRGHYNNTPEFKTANIRATTKYKDPSMSQSVSTDIRIEKDRQILVTVKALGFTIAKAHLTPERVSYYEKFNGQYFEGDFSVLSRWLGTELNFNKIQNLLLGQAINDLNREELLASLESGLHKLESVNPELQSSYYFEDEALLLKKEEIKQASGKRSITISYPSYQKVQQNQIPAEINIEAKQEKSIHLNIRYHQVSCDEELSFPYSVPSDYKRININ